MRLKVISPIFYNDELKQNGDVIELSGLDAMQLINAKKCIIAPSVDVTENREVELTKKTTKRAK